MKKCSKCNELKELSCFGNDKTTRDLLKTQCKDCKREYLRGYSKSKRGKLVVIYNGQITRSKRNKLPPPLYTKNEFIDRFIDCPVYLHHYYSWVISGLSTDYAPSFDRKDDYKGYSFGNIQIMYWHQNNNKCNVDIKNGVNNKLSKAVISVNVKTGKKTRYHSMMDAERKGFNNSHITKCCKGKRKTHYGHKWSYEKQV